MTLSIWPSLPATIPSASKLEQPEKRVAAPLGKVVAATLFLSVPSLAVLALLVWLADLSVLWAIIAQILIWIGIARIVRPMLDDVETVTLWARELGAGADYDHRPVVEDGPAADFVGAVVQIRRREAIDRHELQERARWNQSLFDSLPDPLLLLDQSRKIVQMNSAARSAFGNGLTKDLAVLIRDPQVFAAVDTVLGGKTRHDECEFRTFGRMERTFRARIETLERPGLDGAVALLALQDLTPIRAMERVRQDFVANASHELRTPLAALKGFIETLQGPAKDDEKAREQFLDIMSNEATRLTRLVNDLLSLSRIEGNERVRPNTTCSLASIIARVAATLTPLALKKQMVIETDLDEAADHIIGNEDELTQLIQNLVDNAIKYGKEGSAVTIALTDITLTDQTGCSRLSVTDRGEGIAPEHLSRLTERFYRVDTARSRAMGGTGLGLAIVKHIATRHGASLKITSTLGQGSCFSVDLPKA